MNAGIVFTVLPLVGVGVGALVVLVSVSGLAAIPGQGLMRVIPVRRLRIVTAVILLALAAYSLTKAL